jgi:hypothetical protein
LFSGGEFRNAQSNYSLLLSFAHDIDYWDPTNTSEDMHTTLKALAFGGSGVVRVWSIIENDAVTNTYDRWVQALRHMWGVEELGWLAELYPKISLATWQTITGRALTLFYGGLMPPAYLCMALWIYLGVLDSLSPKSKTLIIACIVAGECTTIVRVALREWFIHRYVLAHRKDFMVTSMRRWVVVVVLFPVLRRLGSLIYNTFATWTVLFKMARGLTTWKYVVAPKAATKTQ